MLLIIAHHFVVNSGVKDLYDHTNPTVSQYFLQVWGMWGKTGINCFILISGYFLCKGRLTWQRYVKLLAEIYFYSLAITAIFVITGYETLTPVTAIKHMLWPLADVGRNFVSSFLCFYAFVPIYNKLIAAMPEKTNRIFVLGLLFYATICGTFLDARTFFEPLWYVILYFVAAYIRLYPNKYTESLKVSSVLLASTIILAIASVVSLIWVKAHLFPQLPTMTYYFVSNSHKILAFAVGLSAFLFAKNCPRFQSPVINWISAGTFAVLLIHAASDTMRHWLWQDIVQVPRLYIESFSGSIASLVMISIITPLIIFAICTTIDSFRRRYIEKPFMGWLLSRWPELK